MPLAWRLLGRYVLLYSVLLGTATSVSVYWITRSGLVVLGLVFGGIVLIATSLGGPGEVRRETISTHAELGVFPGDRQDVAAAQNTSSHVQLFFYGIGLIICGFCVLILIG